MTNKVHPGGMGQFGAAVSAIRRWNVKCVFLWNITKVQKFALPSWSVCRHKILSSTCPRSFQICCIYCDYF